jgi:hypothetical protein
MEYFNRRAIVKMYRNSGDLANKREIVTTVDSANGFRIGFEVEKHITSDPNVALIQIYNLTSSKIEAISNSGIWVELYAGYQTNIPLLYSGAISTVSIQKNGEDTILILSCRTDWKLEKKIYNNTYVMSNASIKNIVINILKTCDIPYSPEHILISGNIGERGWTFANSAKSILDNLARWFYFSWSIQDYGFFAIDDKLVLDSDLKISSPVINVYLFPKEDKRTSAGYDVTCLLNGSFQIGHNVIFDSKYKKRQDFKIYRLSHRGDTHENEWITNLNGYKSGSLIKKAHRPQVYMTGMSSNQI